MNCLDEYWTILEGLRNPPIGVTSIEEINFADLKKIIDLNDEASIKNLMEAMYSGSAWILRNAASPELRSVMLELATEYSKNTDSSFHKMLDGCPNFHRVITEEVTKKYSLYAIKHSFYFYNWNIKTELEKRFKDLVYENWRYKK